MFITPEDYIFFILYFFIFLILLNYIKKRISPSFPGKKFFIPAFVMKAVGALAIGLIYQYFYGYGDTFGYFNMGKLFVNAFRDDAAGFFEIFLTGDRDFYANLAYRYNFSSWYAFTPQTVIVARFSAIFSILGGGYYLTTALFFGLFSFAGVWLLYRTFVLMFPKLNKELAWFILFLPSAFFWGSGLLKDSLSMAGLGFLTYSTYSLFIARRKIISSLVIMLLSSYLIFVVKAYILLSFVPAMLIWVLFEYQKRIKNKVLRTMAMPVMLLILVLAFGFLNNQISQTYEMLSLENITTSVNTQQRNISLYEAGSSYNIGTFDQGFMGFARVIIPALVTTLFRPFPWEINNFLGLLSALESLFFLWFTLWTIRRTGIKKFIRIFLRQPLVLFCFTYSLIFSIAVGIVSENFGTLARYKIPCMSFYLIGLLLINYYNAGKGLPFINKEKRYRKRRQHELMHMQKN